MEEEKFDKLYLIKEILIAQINHLAILPIIITLLCLIKNSITVNLAFIAIYEAFLVLPIVLYCVRKSNLIFLLRLDIYIFFLIIPFVIPLQGLSVEILIACLNLFYIIMSIIIKTKKKSEDYCINVAFTIGICFSAIFITNGLGYNNFGILCCAIAVIEILLSYFIYYLKRYFNFLSVNNSSASHIPAKKMFKSGMILVSGYGILSAVIILLISNYSWLKYILNNLASIIKKIFAKLISMLPSNSDVTVNINPDEAQQEMIDAMSFTTSNEDPFILWIILEKILIFLVYIGLLALFIFVIFKIINFIKNLSHKNPVEYSRLNESMTEIREKCEEKSNEKRKFLDLFKPQTNNQKIRHLYKKKILAEKNILVGDANENTLNLLTSMDSAKKLRLNSLGLIYDKARYSNEECLIDDVNTMKKECKKEI